MVADFKAWTWQLKNKSFGNHILRRDPYIFQAAILDTGPQIYLKYIICFVFYDVQN